MISACCAQIVFTLLNFCLYTFCFFSKKLKTGPSKSEIYYFVKKGEQEITPFYSVKKTHNTILFYNLTVQVKFINKAVYCISFFIFETIMFTSKATSKQNSKFRNQQAIYKKIKDSVRIYSGITYVACDLPTIYHLFLLFAKAPQQYNKFYYSKK